MGRRKSWGRLATLLLSALLVFAVSCKSTKKQPAKPGAGKKTAKASGQKQPAKKPAGNKAAKKAAKKADPKKQPPAQKPEPKPAPKDEPKEFGDEEADLKVRIQKALVEVDRAYEDGLALYKGKRFEESIKRLEQAREILRWMAVKVPGQNERLARINNLITQVKKDKTEFERQREIAQRNEMIRRRRAEELEDARKLRQRIERLFREANLNYRKEEYQQAALLYKEILRLDPTNEDARKLAEIANLSYHKKITDQNRRRLIEEWLRLTEETDLASLPMTRLVRFADEDTWREISKRRPRESGMESGAIEDSETRAIREKLRRKVTLDFSDTPLQDVVQFLRETTGVNMVLDPTVVQERGEEELKVQLRVEQLEVESALKLILELKQLGYQIKNGVVFVTTKDKLGGNSESRVYNVRDLTLKLQDFEGPELSLTSAASGTGGGTAIDMGDDEGSAVTTESLMNLIRDNIAPDSWEGENNIQDRNGMLVIRNSTEVHGRVRQLLSDLRASVGLLVSVETRFLNVTDEFLTDIGVDWRGVGVPDGAPTTTAPAGLPVGGNSVGNNAPYLLPADPTLELEDIIFGTAGTGASPGVSSGAVINGTGPDPGFFYSRNGSFDETGGRVNGRVENLLDGFVTALGPQSLLLPSPLNAPTAGLDLAWAILDRVSAQAILNAVEKSDRATTVRAPRVTAFNTQRANVSVLRQQTYIKDFDVEVAENAAIGDPEIATIQDGVVLDVRPVVSADRRYVTLELRPTLADVTITTVTSSIASGAGDIGSGGGTGTGNISNTTIITIDTPNVVLRELRTTVTMPDGGLVLVGGITQYQQFTEESGIPIISDVPILTFFFSRQRKNRVRRNLLILVKADILALEEYEPRAEDPTSRGQ